MIEGSISNTVSVKGYIVQDAMVEAQADLADAVGSVAVGKYIQVSAGDPLLYIKHSESQPPVIKADESGNVTQTPTEDKVTWSTVCVPVSGIAIPKALKQQETGVGVAVATTTPATYSTTGAANAAQQHRLINALTTVTLTLEGGPVPFQRNNLKVGTKASTFMTTGGDGLATTTSGDGISVEMRCAVPGDQKVFAGMLVTISVDADSISEALMVPVTVVEGKVGSGFAWLVPESGDASKAAKTAAKLGIMDDTNIQIIASLKADQRVLQLVFDKDTRRTGTPDTCEPDNSACYNSEGKEIL